MVTAKLALEDIPVWSGDDLPEGNLPNISGISSKTELDVTNAEQFLLLESSGFDMWRSSKSEDNGEDEGEGIEMNSKWKIF